MISAASHVLRTLQKCRLHFTSTRLHSRLDLVRGSLASRTQERVWWIVASYPGPFYFKGGACMGKRLGGLRIYIYYFLFHVTRIWQ